MKKITLLVIGQLMASVLFVNAQTTPAPYPIGGNGNGNDTGFLQFNNLVVQSVSSASAPGEIVANSGVTILPMQPTMPSAINGRTCLRFDTQDSATAKSVPCPSARYIGPPINASGSASTSADVTGGPMPPVYAPYRIEVSASTNLYLRDRRAATLADFSAGDEINVFGFYNSDGTMQAYLVRDLSKPMQQQFIQLNNADLVSIGGTSAQPTLVVVERPNFPCYNFDSNTGGRNASIACPLGISSTGDNAATKNITVPQSLSMIWPASRKYVVNVNPQTVILDRNRTRLGVGDLKIGDQLNIYGSTNDNGQTVNADIVRDMSQPVTATTYNGTVTQVNADGSFAVQTSDGRTLTVQNPIKVGVTVQLQGVLDSLSNVLSQVTRIFIGTSFTCPPGAMCAQPLQGGQNSTNTQ